MDKGLSTRIILIRSKWKNTRLFKFGFVNFLIAINRLNIIHIVQLFLKSNLTAQTGGRSAFWTVDTTTQRSARLAEAVQHHTEKLTLTALSTNWRKLFATQVSKRRPSWHRSDKEAKNKIRDLLEPEFS